MLTQMLESSNSLQNKTLPEKTVLMKLAHTYQQSTTYLFLDPQELTQQTGLGTIDSWNELLNLQETKNYIKGQMAAVSQIAQRKSFQSLLTAALQGNHQAAKQIQEISGVFNQQDSNRTVVLHRIPRPEVTSNG